ncbi:hypothetical protein ALC53_08194 [Atta colombica]|uniref:Uncharacterized protein n=1 Tax=Atta colombica TaxID=520822 RepID=A0A195BA64_9HYME|nr:hypothetical protein ALC53_08194 [Atta colombica]
MKSSTRLAADDTFDDTNGARNEWVDEGGTERRNQVRHGFLRRARHDGRASPNGRDNDPLDLDHKTHPGS